MKIHGSGRVTLRNRKFLKKITPYSQSDPHSLPAQPHIPAVHPDLPQAEAAPHDQHTGEESPAPVSDGPATVQPEDCQPQQPSHPPSEGLLQDPAPTPAEQPVLRRSARPRVEPQRLNVGSWQGQTYESAVHNVDFGGQSVGAYQDPRLGQLGAYSYNITAPYSVVNCHGLPHSVPGGGGGISGYALPSGLLPSSYQTMYWPSSYVNNTRLVVPQLGYYGLKC